jgi:hypothetical protein
MASRKNFLDPMNSPMGRQRIYKHLRLKFALSCASSNFSGKLYLLVFVDSFIVAHWCEPITYGN